MLVDCFVVYFLVVAVLQIVASFFIKDGYEKFIRKTNEDIEDFEYMDKIFPFPDREIRQSLGRYFFFVYISRANFYALFLMGFALLLGSFSWGGDDGLVG